MTFEPEFLRLYAEAHKLYDCWGDSPYQCDRVQRIMGEPRSMTHVEATLVGTALVNPWEPTLAPLYAQIAATELEHWAFRKIWEACIAVSATQAKHLGTLDEREISLTIVVHSIWVQADRPLALMPSAAEVAISLAGQFVSAANARAIGRHYLAARSEKRLAGEIQQIAAGLRDGDYSAVQCLERFALLHERVSIHGH